MYVKFKFEIVTGLFFYALKKALRKETEIKIEERNPRGGDTICVQESHYPAQSASRETTIPPRIRRLIPKGSRPRNTADSARDIPLTKRPSNKE